MDLLAYSAAAIGLGYAALEFKVLRPRRTKAEIARLLAAIKATKRRGVLNGYRDPAHTTTSGVTTSGVATSGVIINASSFDSNLYMAIAGVRRTGCRLPIVVYTSVQPSNSQAKLITSTHRDVSVVYKRTSLPKIHAILDSPFEQTILLDQDCLCLSNLEELLTHRRFTSTGWLLWNETPQRSVMPDQSATWIRTLLPYQAQRNVILSNESNAQASGAIAVIDKGRRFHGETMVVLSTILREWDSWLGRTPLGQSSRCESELLWIAPELAGDTYAFMNTYPGTIGYRFGPGVKGIKLYLDDFHGLLAMHDVDARCFQDLRSTDFTYYTEDPGTVSNFADTYRNAGFDQTDTSNDGNENDGDGLTLPNIAQPKQIDIIRVPRDVSETIDWYYQEYSNLLRVTI